jgi:surface protein
VKGTGMKQIIYSGFDCPTQVYLNGKIQNLTPCYKLNVNVSGSVIKLIYDVNHFTFIHLREMFYSCEEITEIDMTNFDTSLVTVMDSMFKRCHSLSSLNISNFDTTNVERMDDMFNECYLLKSIDLSSFDTSSVHHWNICFMNVGH